jgi:signal peptidase I
MREFDHSRSGPESALKRELAIEVLRSFGTLRFAATGWSMLPSMWPGDTLMVERVGPDQIHVGDVVLVGRDGRLCAHRVVSRPEDTENPRWVTQGDAMAACDQPVRENELLGRVSSLIRAGKIVAVTTELSVVERLVARIVRRSVRAARALVYLHRVVQNSEKSGPEESVLPCQG